MIWMAVRSDLELKAQGYDIDNFKYAKVDDIQTTFIHGLNFEMIWKLGSCYTSTSSLVGLHLQPPIYGQRLQQSTIQVWNSHSVII